MEKETKDKNSKHGFLLPLEKQSVPSDKKSFKENARAVHSGSHTLSGCSSGLALRKLAICENTMTLENYWHFSHTVRSPETGPSTWLHQLKMRAHEARQRPSLIYPTPLLYVAACQSMQAFTPHHFVQKPHPLRKVLAATDLLFCVQPLRHGS